MSGIQPAKTAAERTTQRAPIEVPSVRPQVSQETTARPATQGRTEPAGDGFDGPRPGAQEGQELTGADLKREQLPVDGVVGRAGGKDVRLGSDPGNYYCERALFSASEKAEEAGSSIKSNDRGEKLVGFIHVPGRDPKTGGMDSITNGTETRYDMAERQKGTAEVVGAGIKGFVEDAQLADPKQKTTKVLLTGYGKFNETATDPRQRIVNNPTGELVRHKSNIDQAMQSAYGDRLVGPGKEVAPGTFQYQIKDPMRPDDAGAYRTVEIRAQEMEVNESAVNGGDTSIQKAIDTYRPDAVISLGVSPRRDQFVVEHHADDGGFTGSGASLTRDRSVGAHDKAYENLALARAIHRSLGATVPVKLVSATEVARDAGLPVAA